MNKTLKIALIGGGASLLLLAALYLRNRNDITDGQVNSVQDVETVLADKTFATKTQAYDALANEKENFYNRPAEAFRAAPAVAATVPTEAPISEPRRVQPQDAQFEQAYREAEQNVRSIYDNTSGAQPVRQQAAGNVQQVVPQTPEERRRKAMLQDWGIEKSGEVGEVSDQTAMCRAVIHGTQVIRPGQPALFRTKEPICYGSLVVPSNTLLSGHVSVNRDRLSVQINSVRINNDVYSLPLEVYGSDGLPGIPLNFNQAGQIADQQLSSTAIQETSSAVSSYGGTLGRVAGAVISGVGSQVRSAKSQDVTLIDNQTILLKIIRQ